jgi:hypothetical protein
MNTARLTMETIGAEGRAQYRDLFPINRYDECKDWARQFSRDNPTLQVRLILNEADEATDGADYLSGFKNTVARYFNGNRIG